MNPCRIIVATALVAVTLGLPASGSLDAQTPTVLNTSVRSYTTVSGSPWVADIWSYTDPQGRDFALVCQGNIGMSVYEVTNPASPVFASSIAATGSDLKDVKTYLSYAYCVQQGGGTLVVDLSDPYNATVVGSIASSGHNCFVYAPAQLLFLARHGESPPNIHIYDISTPANPVLLSTYRPSVENFHDLYVQDDLGYASSIFGSAVGTDIFDVSNPSNPTFINRVPTGSLSHSCWLYNAPGGRKVLCSANEDTGGHLKIYDVTDPNSTPLLSEYYTDLSISIHNPLVVGRYCYISYYADYLRILDMANPSQPVEVGIFDPLPNNAGASTFDGAWGVAHVKGLPGGGSRLLLTESFRTPRGFWVIDFQPPPEVTLGVQMLPGNGFSFNVSGMDPSAPVWNAVSLDTTQPFGAGPVGGLQTDSLALLGLPLGSAPFHVPADASGTYSFTIPSGLPQGYSFDLLSVGIAGGVFRGSQLARLEF